MKWMAAASVLGVAVACGSPQISGPEGETLAGASAQLGTDAGTRQEWLQVSSPFTSISGAQVMPSGNIVGFEHCAWGKPCQPQLTQWSPEGVKLFSHPLATDPDYSGHVQVASSDGAVHVSGLPTTSGPSGTAVFRFEADGSARRVVASSSDESTMEDYAVNQDGTVAYVAFGAYASWIQMVDPQGNFLWQHSFDVTEFHAGAAAFDASGNVLLAGVVNAPFTFQGENFGAPGMKSLAFLKMDPTGALLWKHEVAGLGQSDTYASGVIRHLGVDAQGRIAALASVEGYGTFAGTVLHSGPGILKDVVFYLTAAGQEDFVSSVPSGFGEGEIRENLLLEDGSWVLARANDNKGIVLFHFTADGVVQWAYRFEPTGSGYATVSGLSFADGQLFVSGYFMGTANLASFGTTTAPAPYAGFLMRLLPTP